MDCEYSAKRERIFTWFFKEYRAQNINYRKYYVASEGVRKYGWFFANTSTTGGALLLIFIGAILTGDVGSWATLVSFGLSAIVAASSYVNSSSNFYKLSNEYYNAGQTHQNLFSEMDYLIKEKLPDESVEVAEIEEECRSLVQRKNELNEATPQLPDKWYYLLRHQRNVDWQPHNLQDIRNGIWDFTNEDSDFKVSRWKLPVFYFVL